tara:strand:- start:11724 stop:12164 length:441 start_codon:yes stop_codon:yes gene_type:complete
MKEYLKLKNLHSLFERNFFLLSSLVVDFDQNKTRVFEIPIRNENKKVSINITKLSNYTFDVEFKININAVEEHTIFKVRVYLEAKMAEVISLQSFHNNLIDIIPTFKKFGFQKDERTQWNKFLNEFLVFCIKEGLAESDNLPTRFQ